MGGEFSPPQSEKSEKSNIIEQYLRDKKNKRKKGAQKKGGGGENSPISPPLDPRMHPETGIRPDGPLGSYADFTLAYLPFVLTICLDTLKNSSGFSLFSLQSTRVIFDSPREIACLMKSREKPPSDKTENKRLYSSIEGTSCTKIILVFLS